MSNEEIDPFPLSQVSNDESDPLPLSQGRTPSCDRLWLTSSGMPCCFECRQPAAACTCLTASMVRPVSGSKRTHDLEDESRKRFKYDDSSDGIASETLLTSDSKTQTTLVLDDKMAVSTTGDTIFVWCSDCKAVQKCGSLQSLKLACCDCLQPMKPLASPLGGTLAESDPLQKSDSGGVGGTRAEVRAEARGWEAVAGAQVRGECEQCGGTRRGFVRCACGQCMRLCAPLWHLEPNHHATACCSCWEAEPLVVAFHCGRGGDGAAPRSAAPEHAHVQCVECFTQYATLTIQESRLCRERSSKLYSVVCPMGCARSWIDPLSLKMLGDELYAKYRRYASHHYADDEGVVWCPLPECRHGFLPESRSNKKMKCFACKAVFCHICKAIWNKGETEEKHTCSDTTELSEMDKATVELLQQIAKQCPECKVFIEKNGGYDQSSYFSTY